MPLSRCDRWQIADGVPHRAVVGLPHPWAVRFGRQADRAVAAGEQYEAGSALRHTVFHQDDRFLGVLVVTVVEALEEATERPAAAVAVLNSGDVLDEHDVRQAPFHERPEDVQQRNATIVALRWATGVLVGEGLARGAAAEQDGVRPELPHLFNDGPDRSLLDTGGYERCRGKVRLEGTAGVVVPVKGESDLHVRILKAAARAAGAGEEIANVDAHADVRLSSSHSTRSGMGWDSARRLAFALASSEARWVLRSRRRVRTSFWISSGQR